MHCVAVLYTSFAILATTRSCPFYPILTNPMQLDFLYMSTPGNSMHLYATVFSAHVYATLCHPVQLYANLRNLVCRVTVCNSMHIHGTRCNHMRLYTTSVQLYENLCTSLHPLAILCNSLQLKVSLCNSMRVFGFLCTDLQL